MRDRLGEGQFVYIAVGKRFYCVSAAYSATLALKCFCIVTLTVGYVDTAFDCVMSLLRVIVCVARKLYALQLWICYKCFWQMELIIFSNCQV